MVNEVALTAVTLAVSAPVAAPTAEVGIIRTDFGGEP